MFVHVPDVGSKNHRSFAMAFENVLNQPAPPPPPRRNENEKEEHDSSKFTTTLQVNGFICRDSPCRCPFIPLPY
jgi:hypothetical protein